jgi:hypothetical protein
VRTGGLLAFLRIVVLGNSALQKQDVHEVTWLAARQETRQLRSPEVTVGNQRNPVDDDRVGCELRCRVVHEVEA